jgi:hypothetical protein
LEVRPFETQGAGGGGGVVGSGLATIRSIRWCTYTVVGGLLTPMVVAVICAVPTGPGVHIWGVASEFQVPAQALPLLAMVTTAGLLDTYETGSLMFLAVLVWGVPVKVVVEPISMDAISVGESSILAGTSNVVPLVGLLPQPIKADVKIRRMIAHTRETELPMYPPRLVVIHGASILCSGKFPV